MVRDCFRQWQDLGIGLVLTEVGDRSEAELRIGFQPGDGSWSAVGKDALRVGLNDRTMNFGWDLTAPGERATALHQIGHALGMLHEHQSPYSGILWDDEAVYAELAGPPNHWSRERTFHNILRKLDGDEANGPVWDPQSIMEYPFPSGLILEPEHYRSGLHPPGTLSAADKEFALRWYPPLGRPGPLVPFRSVPLGLGPGEQADFRVDPPETREYTVGTFGDSDAVVVVFEVRDGRPRYLAGHDDGGTPATPRSGPVSSRAAAMSSGCACTPRGCGRDGGHVLVTARSEAPGRRGHRPAPGAAGEATRGGRCRRDTGHGWHPGRPGPASSGEEAGPGRAPSGASPGRATSGTAMGATRAGPSRSCCPRRPCHVRRDDRI